MVADVWAASGSLDWAVHPTLTLKELWIHQFTSISCTSAHWLHIFLFIHQGCVPATHTVHRRFCTTVSEHKIMWWKILSAPDSWGALRVTTSAHSLLMDTVSQHVCLDKACGSAVVCGFCQSVGGKTATGPADTRNNTDWTSSWSAEMMTVSHRVSRARCHVWACAAQDQPDRLIDPCYHFSFSFFFLNRKVVKHSLDTAVSIFDANITTTWWEKLKCLVKAVQSIAAYRKDHIYYCGVVAKNEIYRDSHVLITEEKTFERK